MIEVPTDLRPVVVQGNAVELLAAMPEQSVHVVVTSPAFWGLRRYDICPCAQEYVREEGIDHPMPKKQGRAVREKKPDPSCKWCGGTGTIPGMETVWGGDPACGHADTTPTAFVGGGKPPEETGGVRWQHTGKGEPGHYKVGGGSHQWESTPPRRSRRAADEGNLPSHGNYDAAGGRICGKCGAWFGALGCEPTPFMYVEHVVELMRGVRRVLRDDGTVWMEIGDTYLTHPAGLTGAKRWKASTLSKNRDMAGAEQAGVMDKRQPGIREGNLALVPHRVAIALQEDGWIIKQDDVWSRPNPMPESTKKRPTRSHSYVFLLAKEPGWFYDNQAVRQPQTGNAHARGNGRVRKPLAEAGSGTRYNASYNAAMVDQPPPEAGRNLLSVWQIPTQAFPGKHYATFPLRIPEIAISNGTSERGCCPECGAPWERVTATQVLPPSDRVNNLPFDHPSTTNQGEGATTLRNEVRALTVGWTPSCAHFPDPCDKCGTAWAHRTILRRVSTQNVRVRDAKYGDLGSKSGWRRTVAEAVAEEYEDEHWENSQKLVEADVSWPGCSCRPLVPAVVLDPFAGSGTTLLVARTLYRRSIGLELSPFYVDMCRRRLAEETTLLAPRLVSQSRLTQFAEAV